MKSVKGRLEMVEHFTKFPVKGFEGQLTQGSLRAEGYEEDDFINVDVMGFSAPSINTLKDTAKTLIKEDIMEDLGCSEESHRITVGEWDRVTAEEGEERYVVHVEVAEREDNFDVDNLYYGLVIERD